MRTKSYSVFFLCLFALPISAGVGEDGKKEKDWKPQPKSVDGPALKGFDPVLLTRGEEKPGDKSHTVVKGKFRYYFVSEENRKLFEGNPNRYGIQLDGHCAAMPNEQGNADLFAVSGGKIYIFGSPDCKTRFMANPSTFLNPAKKKVAIFIHPSVELLDFAGPAEVFASANHRRSFEVFTVAADSKELTSQGFLKITPQYTIDNCPKPDIIVLPGGDTRIPLRDERVNAWIKKCAPDCEVVMSVCTGAFLLAKAGLLDGQDATTHWGSIEGLKKAAPKATIHSNRRFLDNGKIVTTAGVSAGIDGALHVVERLVGREAAESTAKYMEYRWQRELDSKESVVSGSK